MVVQCGLIFLGIIAVTSAVPVDHVIAKLDPGLRYQYVASPEGIQLVDLWLKTSDVLASARFDPAGSIGFHLFTRSSRYVSQPLPLEVDSILNASNFDRNKKTVILVHGWSNTPESDFNVYLVNAYLTAEDVNLIMVDWSVGAAGSYLSSLSNSIRSGELVARFVTWLNRVSGADISRYHIIGHSLGGHQAGIIGRRLGGRVPYITSLDPALPGWITHPESFKATDGIYTEVIHTDVGTSGLITPSGDVDFYPNRGRDMPGCSNRSCSHHQCIFYMAESLVYGGFTGRRCANLSAALTGNCNSSDTVTMGGRTPKTGASGIFYLTTNNAYPFSQG